MGKSKIVRIKPSGDVVIALETLGQTIKVIWLASDKKTSPWPVEKPGSTKGWKDFRTTTLQGRAKL